MTRPPTLPERTVRGGAHMVVHVGRRTISYAGPTEGTRLQRAVVLLLLVPVLAIVLVLGAIAFALLLIAAAVVAAVLAVAALVFRRQLQRPQ